MSVTWRRWAGNDPKSLIEYVQRRRQGVQSRTTPADLLGTQMPAPGDGPPAGRARALYEAFAARGIQYADEPTTSDPGRQSIRTPDEVLNVPRHATCLDLAATYAGACLDAGLHPLIIICAGTRPGAPAHALVAVWLDGNWSNCAHKDYRADEQDPDWQSLPPDFLDRVADDAQDAPGSFFVIDITGVASRPDAADPRRRQQWSWDESVAHGVALLRAAAPGRLRVTIDVGLGYEHIEPQPLPDGPGIGILTEPYRPLPQNGGEIGPLTLLGARYDVIRFQARDELDFLLDWFQVPDPAGTCARIALLHGVGGAGKTRLAAELAQRLARTGWYTGFLARYAEPQDRAWLSRTASPLLVVVDYTEVYTTEEVVHLLRALAGREAPTCVLLTARTIGEWWSEIEREARRAHYLLQNIAITPRHPRHTSVWRAALRAFGSQEAVAMGSSPPPDPDSGRWTTLDLVMLAWLAARPDSKDGNTTYSRRKLYDEILRNEMEYWKRVYHTLFGAPPPPWTKAALREAAACLSLLAPTEERLDHSLQAISQLATDSTRRDKIATLLSALLPVAPEDGTLAVRPDPVGTYLAHDMFSKDPDLLNRCLAGADPDEQLNACVSITWFAASQGPSESTGLAAAALRATPDLWQPALHVAAMQGGVFVPALERLAAAENTPLPLAELAATVPANHGTLRNLSLIAAERSFPDDSAEASEDELSARAGWLHILSIRRADSGDREGALAAGREAVTAFRALTEGNPVHLTGLATALNNLGRRQSETGDHTAAFDTIIEAVGIFRTLAQSEADPHLAHLATALNNLSIEQLAAGDPEAALVSSTDAVAIHRSLARTSPAARLPDLAMSLNNLSNAQSTAGDTEEALDSVREATDIYRDLASSAPAAHLPHLAGSLHNLALRQWATGDHTGALDSITEAVALCRALARTNAAAFLPDLATALGTLGSQQGETGDRAAALTSLTEATDAYRALARGDARFLPRLAATLGRLSAAQEATGRHAEALEAATEAVAILRDLARAKPVEHLSGLATALDNLAVQQNQAGRYAEATEAATEAVAILRDLARAKPAEHLAGLATALSNLAARQGESGDPMGALEATTEAVAILRDLARAKPAEHLAGLAAALNNLAVWQRGTGQGRAAVASATEALALSRTLAARNPVVFTQGLAESLYNLAALLTETGDPEGALASATEAVALCRTLAADNPDVHLPGLAEALNTLAVCQADTGHPKRAMAAITEAIAIRRTLSRANPAIFLPGLAMSLNNLARQQNVLEDHESALASTTEAVQIYRTLWKADPGAFRVVLAQSLNNLSNAQSTMGDCVGALASITESVALCRTLCETDGATHHFRLATGLVNLSNVQSETGDHEAVLVSITEAVELFRALAQADPASHNRSLTTALHNLALRQAEAGDHKGALASANEAVLLLQPLAQASPAVYLPELASALDNLAERQTAVGDPSPALRTSDRVISELPSGPQAVLRASRVRFRLRHDDLTGAVADVLSAAHLADTTDDSFWTGRSRRAVRRGADMVRRHTAVHGSLGRMLQDLPDWAKAELAPATLTHVDTWSSLRNWPERDAFLRETYPHLSSPEARTTLDLMRALYPEAAALGVLATVLDAAAHYGLSDMLEQMNGIHIRSELLNQWLATPTWPENLEFLVSHPQLTQDPQIRELLAAQWDDQRAHQHLAILELTDHLPAPEVFDAVIDLETAIDTAMRCLGQGQPEVLRPLLAAAPALTQLPFVTPYLLAVYTLFCPDVPASSPVEFITHASTQGSEVQRGAGAARLRQLAKHRPEQADALHELAAVLTSGGTEQGVGGTVPQS